MMPALTPIELDFVQFEVNILQLTPSKMFNYLRLFFLQISVDAALLEVLRS